MLGLILGFAVGFPLSAAAEPAGSRETPVTTADRVGAAKATQRIEELRAQIAHHDVLYFEHSAPEITDAEYDALKRELVRLERAFPSPAPAPPAPFPIGDDRTNGFAKHRHLEPMLSLDKAYTELELRAFLARMRGHFGQTDLVFVIEPKFDGLALSVTYEKGELVRAVTRGNGREGDDVTANVRAIANIPRHLRALAADGTRNPIPDVIELRGEVFLGTAEFRRINREQEAAGEPLFSHPRNLAAGTLKQRDPRDVATRGLEAVFYTWGGIQPANLAPTTQREFHALVHAWGLPGVKEFKSATTDNEVWAAIQALGEARSTLKFPTDGAVVKLDAVAGQRDLGASDSAPRWAMAYKFTPERAATKLLGITLQIGRTGVLTPVAELAPVQLAGTKITRASLYNRDEIARRDLRIGDTVVLEKAGEIVPAIVSVDLRKRPTESRPFFFPSKCPSCEASIATDAAGVLVYCLNRDCPAQVQRRLEHFASKAAVNIPGLGPATIETLVAKSGVKEISDLYRLSREQPLPLGRDASVSSVRLLAAIEESKHAELWRFIHGLGIPHVGAATARELARRYPTLAALAASTSETLTPRDHATGTGIGETAAQAVQEYFRDPRHRALIADLATLGVAPVREPALPGRVEPGHLAGKNFVLTGTLRSLTREEVSARIVAAGGTLKDRVDRKTDFLVAGPDAGAKLKQAESLGVEVIDEAELLKLLACESPSQATQEPSK